MKTDDLVTMLATGNTAVAPRALEQRFALGLGFGASAAVLLMLITLGVREDLMAATRMPMFWVKLLFAGSLASVSLVVVARLARPGRSLGRAPVALASPLLALWLLALVTLCVAAPEQRSTLLFGETWTICPLLIAMLALPLLLSTLWIMAGLAPTRARLAGAAGGLLSGAIATLVYSLHCPEMAAPFVAVWYVAGIVIPTILGALLGPRCLRW